MLQRPVGFSSLKMSIIKKQRKRVTSLCTHAIYSIFCVVRRNCEKQRTVIEEYLSTADHFKHNIIPLIKPPMQKL